MKAQPIIFLDFDGPIRTLRARVAGFETDPVAVRAIHNALRDAGAKLVIIANLRLSGREECVKVIDSVKGYELSPFLHANWCVSGQDDYPAARTRGAAINHWFDAGDSGNDVSWEASLVIDDLLIRSYYRMANQAVADTTEGLGCKQLQEIAEWAAEWRSRR